MPKFKANDGREYSVTLSLRDFKRFKNEVEIDVLNFSNEEFIALTEDVLTVAELLYSAVEDQCKSKGVSADEFLMSISGDAVEGAVMAFFRAYADFCPRAKRDAMNKYLDIAEQSMRLMDADIEAMTHGKPSISLQE